jgi:fumarate reductase (CoM/CoB) subunit A
VLAYPESVRGILIGYEALLAREYLDFKLVNNKGKEFLPEGPLPARDILMQSIFAEIERGGETIHNAVYIDPSRSSRNYEEVDELVNNLLRGIFRNLKKLGIDIRKDRIEVRPAVHYTLGGIHINEKTETSVQGLFAAGENSSNVHGANRISGNALAETQVFGARAGAYASERAKKKRHLPIPIRDVEDEIRKWNYFMEKKGKGIRAQVLRKELKRIMDVHVGSKRNEEGMKKALQRVVDIKENGLSRVQVSGGKIFNVDWRTAIEISMSLDLAELVIRSALFRKETRGHHFRYDFPETLETPKHTLVTKKNRKTDVVYTPVRKVDQ